MDFLIDAIKNMLGDGSLINAVGVIVAVIAVVVVTWAVRQFALHEQVAKLQKAWGLVDNVIADLIVFVATNLTSDHADLIAAEEEAKVLAEQGTIIDYRMLYVVKEAQRFVKTYTGFEPDFMFIYRKAEHVFQKLKADGTLKV